MVKILQHYTPNWKPLIDITRPIHQEYADRHGYELVVKEVPEYKVYTGIEKLSMFFDELERGDIGFFIDADCLITNQSIKIEPMLWIKSDFYFSSGLNCGVFVIRKTIFSAGIIKELMKGIKQSLFFCEQDGFEQIIGNITRNPHFSICDHPCFNSFIPELYGHIQEPEKITEKEGRWVEGSFICHLPALGMETRLQKLKELKEKIVR